MTEQTARFPGGAWMWIVVAAFWILLIFSKLGQYALWDDESLVALSAKGIQRTGDTSVMLDHGNIVAYRDGLCIEAGADRSTPPLAAYLTAASFDFFGISPLTARLPFALLGLGTGGLLFVWAKSLRSPARWVLLAAIFGNVSLMLFSRQCRYYSPALFFSLAIVTVYWRWRTTPWHLFLISILSACLFAANYMSYAALSAGLTVDYLTWRRRESPLGWRNSACLLVPQATLIAAIASVWNPFRTPFGSYEVGNTLGDRLTLFGWLWRDMDRCEFFALPLILIAFVMSFRRDQIWLRRACVALLVYVAVIALVSPQLIRQSQESEVRYVAPIIPLALAIQVGALCALLAERRAWMILVTLLAFGTNLFNGGPFLAWGWRSTILSYLGELSLPQHEPYTPTAAWINQQVPENASVWVTPYYATYPLMFAAPRAFYAWQLSWPPSRSEFAKLPALQFAGRTAPDFIVAFGPARKEVEQLMKAGTIVRISITAPPWHFRCFGRTNTARNSTGAEFRIGRKLRSGDGGGLCVSPGEMILGSLLRSYGLTVSRCIRSILAA